MIVRLILAAAIAAAIAPAQPEYVCDWVTPFNKVITDMNTYGPRLGAGIRDLKLRAQLRRHIADLESCPCF